ncbi:MAG: hypothetical protein K0S76_2377 [Herbinix sp.]|nr:hypothetical protein [Herbinix sp.]
MRRKIVLSVVFLFALSFAFFGNASTAYAEEADNRICQGVFIDEVDVSGMTREEAVDAVNDFVNSLRKKGIAIRVDDDVVYTTLGDLGYKAEPYDYIEQALDLGKAGNIIRRYKDLKDIEQGRKVYPLTYSIDEKKLNKLISKEVSAYNDAPKNASVSRKNNKFIYTDHVIGRKVEESQTAQVVKDAIFDNWNRTDIVVEAVIEDDMPMFTRDIVELCNTKLGSFTTEYTSSDEDRAGNLANGARLINNTVLYPGDMFSGYEYLHPFSVENGYFMAHAYLNGNTIDSIGGGACQVTTTLYNAALFSELEIVQRNPHSMTISYVDLSRDSAIAGTSKDLKFVNNTDAPILIEAYTVNKTITFNIWGHESRDAQNRRVEFETKVISETPAPADVITEDPTKPETFRDVTQSAHNGYKAELYKVVYENNIEVSRTLVNKSSYAAAPRRITIGTKKVEKAPPKKTDKDNKEDDKETTQTNSPDGLIEGNSIAPINQTNPQSQLQVDLWDLSRDLNDIED